MNRRKFLTASAVGLGASKLNLSATQNEAADGKSRQYYELRQYHVQSGRQQKTTDSFLRDALVPALNRLGISPVGVFNVEVGDQSPRFHVLLPAASVDVLATAELRLGQDAEYLKTGAPFLTAPADQPAHGPCRKLADGRFRGMAKAHAPSGYDGPQGSFVRAAYLRKSERSGSSPQSRDVQFRRVRGI